MYSSSSGRDPVQDHYGMTKQKAKNDVRGISKSTLPTASGPPRSSGDLGSRHAEWFIFPILRVQVLSKERSPLFWCFAPKFFVPTLRVQVLGTNRMLSSESGEPFNGQPGSLVLPYHEPGTPFLCFFLQLASWNLQLSFYETRSRADPSRDDPEQEHFRAGSLGQAYG